MLKVYTLIDDFSLNTSVDVAGRMVRISFSGGCKAMHQNGEFMTNCNDLQKAIEQSSSYGKVFKLSKSIGKAEKAEEMEENGEHQLNLEDKVCRTVNEAIDWLVELGCKKSEVNTSAKAIESARGIGYNLRFEKGE